MARGITESDVHTAADELVARGERPTVERIRAHLGTGSPNTVIRWLETWWNKLAARLEPRRSASESAPAALMELAGEWWELALNHARQVALQELAAAEQSLTDQRNVLEAQSRLAADELSQAHSERAAAVTAERIASARATELQHLVDQIRLQMMDLSEQRDIELRRADRAETARQQLDARLQEASEVARSEREEWAEYVKSVESRALGDVDRARQETKELQAKQNNSAELHVARERQLREDLTAAQSLAATATQTADILRGKCDALEGQLSILRDLPAKLEATLKRPKGARSPTVLGPRRRQPKR